MKASQPCESPLGRLGHWGFLFSHSKGALHDLVIRNSRRQRVHHPRSIDRVGFRTVDGTQGIADRACRVHFVSALATLLREEIIMIALRDPSLVGSIPDPDIRQLIEQRFAEITGDEPFDPDIHGQFIIVEPGDSVAALEKEVGIPILRNLFDDVPYGDPDFTPCFEVLEEHQACFEMVFIMGDGDGGTVIIIPKTEGINPDLLAMCAQYAVPAPDLAEA